MVFSVENVDRTAGVVVVGKKQSYSVVFGGEGCFYGLAVTFQQRDLGQGAYSFQSCVLELDLEQTEVVNGGIFVADDQEGAVVHEAHARRELGEGIDQRSLPGEHVPKLNKFALAVEGDHGGLEDDKFGFGDVGGSCKQKRQIEVYFLFQLLNLI